MPTEKFRLVCDVTEDDALVLDPHAGCVDQIEGGEMRASVFLTPTTAREFADALYAWAKDATLRYVVNVYNQDGSTNRHVVDAGTYSEASEAAIAKQGTVPVAVTVVTGDEGVRAFQISESYDA